MNEIDDIFKEAAQAESATFKPEYWEQYAEQFNGDKKKRKGILGFFFAGLIFVSGIALLFYNNSYEGQETKMATNYTRASQKQNSENIESNELTTLLIAKAQNEKLDKESLGRFEPVNNAKEINEKMPLAKNTNQTNSRALSQTKANPTILSRVETTNSNINESTTESSSFIRTTQQSVSNPKPLFSALLAMDEEKMAKTETVVGNSKTIDSAENSLAIAEVIVEENTNDSVTNAEPEPTSKAAIVTRSKMKKLQFNVQVGTNVYNDFNLYQNNRDIKTGLMAGIEVEYMLKPNVTLSLGVNGYNRTSDGLNIDFDYLDYGFGEVNTRKTYSYTDLYFVEVPVSLNYVINSRHKIGAGATFTRLLTTKVNVKEETKDTKYNDYSSSNSSQYLYHYNTFVLNNTGIHVNYQYMFKRVGVNIGYTQGLNEFLNKETFNSSRFNSLNKLTLSIKYKL